MRVTLLGTFCFLSRIRISCGTGAMAPGLPEFQLEAFRSEIHSNNTCCIIEFTFIGK